MLFTGPKYRRKRRLVLCFRYETQTLLITFQDGELPMVNEDLI